MPPGVTLELDELLGTDELLRIEELLTTDELLGTLLGADELVRTEELLGGNDELERLLVVATLEDDNVPQLLGPNGAGWLVQVAREIQLLLFS